MVLDVLVLVDAVLVLLLLGVRLEVLVLAALLLMVLLRLGADRRSRRKHLPLAGTSATVDRESAF